MERSKTITKKEMLDVHQLLATPIFKKDIKREEAIEKHKGNVENIFIKNKRKDIRKK